MSKSTLKATLISNSSCVKSTTNSNSKKPHTTKRLPLGRRGPRISKESLKITKAKMRRLTFQFCNPLSRDKYPKLGQGRSRRKLCLRLCVWNIREQRRSSARELRHTTPRTHLKMINPFTSRNSESYLISWMKVKITMRIYHETVGQQIKISALSSITKHQSFRRINCSKSKEVFKHLKLNRNLMYRNSRRCKRLKARAVCASLKNKNPHLKNRLT